MSAAQLLLRRLLDQAGGATETGYLLVIDGEGLENLPDQMPTPKGAYAVHRITTELGLRHLLWKAKGAPLIAVMPEDVARRIQKAPDLLRRARNQRVQSLSVAITPPQSECIRTLSPNARRPHGHSASRRNDNPTGYPLQYEPSSERLQGVLEWLNAPQGDFPSSSSVIVAPAAGAVRRGHENASGPASYPTGRSEGIGTAPDLRDVRPRLDLRGTSRPAVAAR